MTERNYRQEAEKLVAACQLLEKEYVKAFNNYRETEDSNELHKCEIIARRLDKIDPDLKLQSGNTLPEFFANHLKQSFGEEHKSAVSQYEKFVRIAIRLLQQGKYKPLR